MRTFEQQLNNYYASTFDDVEAQGACIELLDEPDAFERTRLEGHFTGSALIVDPTRKKVLLTHHKKLDRWLQLGGHCDGIRDPFFVAWKEAYEESGLKYLEPSSAAIVDIDIHTIPANKAVPRHLHYDIRYRFMADSTQPFVVSNESIDLRWFDMDDVETLQLDFGLRKLMSKAWR